MQRYSIYSRNRKRMKENESNLLSNTSELNELLMDGPNMMDVLCNSNGQNDFSDEYEYGPFSDDLFESNGQYDSSVTSSVQSDIDSLDNITETIIETINAGAIESLEQSNIPISSAIYNQVTFNKHLVGAVLLQGSIDHVPHQLRVLEPLYADTDWNVQDLLLILEMFKVTGKISDGFENCILGLLASVLPPNNAIANQLKETSGSNYFFQKTIKSGHSQYSKMRVFSIPVCHKGCTAFVGDLAEEEKCEECGNMNHPSINETIYYFPLYDRLKRIVKSDLLNFLLYEKVRQPPLPGYIEDVFDGSTWKWFQQQMGPNDRFIGLTFCWDGADMFEFSGKCIWPLSVSIINFPKDLRDKLNVGLHVVSMCSGIIYC